MQATIQQQQDVSDDVMQIMAEVKQQQSAEEELVKGNRLNQVSSNALSRNTLVSGHLFAAMALLSFASGARGLQISWSSCCRPQHVSACYAWLLFPRWTSNIWASGCI